MHQPIGCEILNLQRESSTLHPVLLWDEGGCILIDAGIPGQTGQIREALQGCGLAPESLTRLIFTHQDLDHIGSAGDLLASVAACETLAHEAEAPYIDGTLPPVKGFESRHVPIARTLRDGDVLPVCGGIEVVHTPGHTPGHICLLLRRHGLLVAGDALNARDGRLAGPNPQYTRDMPTALASLRKLLSLDFDAVATYHGGVARGELKEQIAGLAES